MTRKALSVPGEIRAGRRARVVARRRRRVRAVAMLMITGALLAGGWRLTRTSLFELSNITVVGARSVSPAAVVSVAGVRVGDSALSIDLDLVASRIKGLPSIRDVRVEREGAAGLRIVVSERVAVAEVQSGARRWLVDEDGQVVLGVRPKGPLPVIRVASGERALTESAIAAPAAVRDVMAVWSKLLPDERARVAWFTVSSAREISMQIGSARVAFGRPEAIGAKLLALRLLEERARERGSMLVTADVRSPTHPAARMR